ncbi:MAG: YiiX/YebB-like N1pC/P60 family cysteine hydrolase [Myxococcaceae bacterium]
MNLVPLLVAAKLVLAGAPVYALPEAAFVEQARADLATLKLYGDGLRRLQGVLTENEVLFATKQKEPYSPEQKRTLLTTWGAFFSYVISAEAIRQRYWDFLKLLPTDPRHPWGFLLTHTALTVELAHGLTLADLAAGHPQLEVLFDEPNAEFGIPSKAFAQLKVKVIHLSTSTQLLTGDAYGHQLLPTYKKLGMLDDARVRWALEEMKHSSKAARDRLSRRGAKLFLGNAVDIVKDGAASALFPVQKDFAAWAGDTRVARAGKPLISAAQVKGLIEQLQPGDLMVARQNWFLSNIGLPGFWPHAELYLGTAAELSAFFDEDPEVLAWVKGMPARPASFSAYLEARYPEKWKAYRAGKDLQGNSPLRIIEAVSEGVSFTAAPHGMQVDYLGVMRPRLSRLEKARAVDRAFGYQGRPYDFDFDFFSDATLVCSELVYKSYAPSGELRGIRIGLVEVAGRRTLPANELVRLFDEEYGRPGRQLDFVAFLDGQEAKGEAVAGTVDSFRKSHGRVKWDVAQK